MGFDFFWNEQIWLPENIKWEDFKPRLINGSHVYYPQAEDFSYSIVAGILLLILRIFIECFVFLPIGVFSGWMKLQPGQSMLGLCFKHLNLEFAGKSKFKRVSETAWRFLYYTTIWCAGIYVLKDQPQWADIDASWSNYPYHEMNNGVWFYYIIQTGFYWSLLFSAFTIDVRRSDFWEMALHHAITILLLAMSFSINFVRVGTMVLICHDTADILLDFGKLMRYAKWERCLTVVFCALLLTWIISRVFYFPLVIIRSVIVAAPEAIQKNYKWTNLFQRPIVPRLFLLMLCMLVCLHVFWTAILLKIAYQSTQKGKDLNDIREESSGDEDEGTKEKKQ